MVLPLGYVENFRKMLIGFPSSLVATGQEFLQIRVK